MEGANYINLPIVNRTYTDGRKTYQTKFKEYAHVRLNRT